jgi:NAD(P)-dependent dehydrogenase (short-subunit alcohol dehydrogenase family)
MKMQNKVALVTGAALGYKYGGLSIGSAFAFKLASEEASVYPVTKAAINALTRTLAVDFAPHIQANPTARTDEIAKVIAG